MKTMYSYFRGGNGVGIGAEMAGFRDVGGVEFDAQIATACDVNFPNAPTTVADVCSVDPALLLNEAPTWFHASPSCKNASQAKTAGEDGVRETEQDKAAGQAVARFIRHWQPPIVTIENVWQYRTFEAFGAIEQALRESGYSFDSWHLNAADYGVAQTRKRLILVARRGLLHIQRPNPTHRQGGDMFHPPWIGWYECIEDLIPELPESKFAQWQLERLPDELKDSLIFCNNDPEWGLPYKYATAPMPTITTQTGPRTRAFIVPIGTESAVRYDDEPSHTTTSAHYKNMPKAWLVDGDGNRSREPTVLDQDTPSMTIQAWHGRRPIQTPRAWLSQGRVVKMTPRALARFQSLPDSYILPEKSSLACTVIGNAVPSLLMHEIVRPLLCH